MKFFENKYVKGALKGRIKISLATMVMFCITGHLSYGAFENPAYGDSFFHANLGNNESKGNWGNNAGIGTHDKTTGGAKGENTVTGGVNAEANGNNSMAIGNNAKTNESNSTVIGIDAITVKENSIAIGTEAESKEINSTIIGTNAQGLGENSQAFGQNSKASAEDTIAIGKDSEANSKKSIAIGNESQAQGVNSTIIGTNAQGLGKNSQAFGQNSKALADDTIAIGKDAEARGKKSFAIGNESQAQGENSIAFGDGAQTLGAAKDYTEDATAGYVRIRSKNDIDEKYIIYSNDLENNTEGYYKFIKGTKGKGNTFVDKTRYNELSEEEKKQFDEAKTVYRNIKGTDTFVDFGKRYRLDASDMIAIGKSSTAKRQGSIAFGSSSSAIGENSIAEGYKSQAIGNETIAIGKNSKAGLINTAREFESDDKGNYINVEKENGEFREYRKDGLHIRDDEKVFVEYEEIGKGKYDKGRVKITKGFVEYGKVKNNPKYKIFKYTKRDGDFSIAIGSGSMAIDHGTMAIGEQAFAGFKDEDFIKDDKGNYIEKDGDYIEIYNLGKNNENISRDRDGKLILKRPDGQSDLVIDAASYDNLKEGTKEVVAIYNESKNIYTLEPYETYKSQTRYRKDLSKHKVTGANSIAVGYKAEATNLNSMAFGYMSHATDENSLAIGNEAESTGYRGLALGQKAKAGFDTNNEEERFVENETGIYIKKYDNKTRKITYKRLDTPEEREKYKNVRHYSRRGDSTMAIGYMAKSNNYSSVAIGHRAQATGMKSMAVGNHTKALGREAGAYGYESLSNGDYAYAVGTRAFAGYDGYPVDGYYENNKNGIYVNINAGETPKYKKYNDLSPEEKAKYSKNKFYTKNANDTYIEISPNDTNAVRYININEAKYVRFENLDDAEKDKFKDKPRYSHRGDRSFAIGNEARATNFGSIALGYSSLSTGIKGLALGNRTESSGKESTAIGYDSHANGSESVAFGFRTRATGEKSLAFGNNSLAGYLVNDYIVDNFGDYTEENGKYYKINNNEITLENGNKKTLEKNRTKYRKIKIKQDTKNHFVQNKIGDFIYLGKETEEDAKLHDFGNFHKLIDYYENENGKVVKLPANKEKFSQEITFDEKGQMKIKYVANNIDGEFVKVGKEYRKIKKYFNNNGKEQEISADKYKERYFAKSDYNVALGYNTRAANHGATAIGYDTHAIGSNSLALGHKSASIGQTSIAIGDMVNAQGNKSIAIGSKSYTLGDNSIVLGNDSYAGGYEKVVGKNIIEDLKKHDKLYINNKGIYEKYDEKIHKNIDSENYRRQASTGINTIVIGNNANANYSGAIAIGDGTNATSLDSMAIGNHVFSGFTDIDYIKDKDGKYALIDGKYKIAPTNYKGQKYKEVVIAKNNGNMTIAVGTNSVSSNSGAATFGYNSLANGERSTALGNEAFAGFDAETKYIKRSAKPELLKTDKDENKRYLIVSGKYVSIESLRKEYEKDKNKLVEIGGKDIKLSSIFDSTGANKELLNDPYVSAEDGDYALAIGYDARATRHGASAVGYGSRATANYTIAYGVNTEASAENAISFGNNSKATKKDSFAAGTNASAEGVRSISFGNKSSAEKDDSMAIGFNTKALGIGASAVGNNASATGENSSAFGGNSQATGKDSIAKGNSSYAGYRYDVAKDLADKDALYLKTDKNEYIALNKIDDKTKIKLANGTTSTSANEIKANLEKYKDSIYTKTNGDYTIAVGTKARATNEAASAYGYEAHASGNHSSAYGYKTKALGNKSLAVGNSSLAGIENEFDYISIASKNLQKEYQDKTNKKLYVLDEKTHNYVELNSLSQEEQKEYQDKPKYARVKVSNIVYKDGVATDKTEDKKDADFSLSLGYHATATNNGASAMGYMANAVGKKSTAVGYGSTAFGENSMSLGTNAISAGVSSLALGNEAITDKNALESVAIGIASMVSGEKSTAIGGHSKASGKQSTSIGINSESHGKSAVAIGDTAKAKADHSISIGASVNDNIDNGKNSAAIGYLAKSKGISSMAFGFGAQSLQEDSIAIGTNAKSDEKLAIAIGKGAQAKEEGSIAIGQIAKANYKGAVAIGDGAVADASVKIENSTINGIKFGDYKTFSKQMGAVSVGNIGYERQIKNVAAGLVSSDSTDAINGSQLYSTNNILANLASSTKTAIGGNAILDEKGNITLSKVGGTDKNTIDEAIKALNDSKLDSVHEIFNTNYIRIVSESPNVGTSDVGLDLDVSKLQKDVFPVIYTDKDGDTLVKVKDKYYKASQVAEDGELIVEINGKKYANGLDGEIHEVGEDGDIGKVVENINISDKLKEAEKKNIKTDDIMTSLVSADRNSKNPIILHNVKSTIGNNDSDKKAIDETKAQKNIEDLIMKNSGLNIAATTGDMQALAIAGLDFSGDDDNSFIHKNLGAKLSIKGDGDFTSYAKGNLKVVKENDELKIKLNNTITLNDGNGHNTIIIDGIKSQIKGLAEKPEDDTSATSKKYVDDQIKKMVGSSEKDVYIHINSKSTAATEKNTSNAGKIDEPAGAIGGRATAIGIQAQSYTPNSIAIGTLAKAGDEFAKSIGKTDRNSVAIGHMATSKAGYTLALGTRSRAQGVYSTAIGASSLVDENGKRGIAIGARATIGENYKESPETDTDGQFDAGKDFEREVENEKLNTAYTNGEIKGAMAGVAIGRYSHVTEDSGIALGQMAEVKARNSVAIGRMAEVQNVEDGIALGSYSNVVRDKYTIGEFISNEAIKNDENLQKYINISRYDELNDKSIFDTLTKEEEKEYENLKKLSYISDKKENYFAKIKPENKAFISTSGALSIGNKDKNILRQITNVAAGSEDTDAVNVAQLRSLKSDIQNTTNIYFHVNDGKNKENTANLDNSGAINAIGGAKGSSSIAVGVNVQATGDKSIAIGNKAFAGSLNYKVDPNGTVTKNKKGIFQEFANHKEAKENSSDGKFYTHVDPKTNPNIYLENNKSGVYVKEDDGTFKKYDNKEKAHEAAEKLNDKNTYSKKGDLGIAIGNSATADNFESIALGFKSLASGYKSMALGNQAKVTENGRHSTAIGYKSEVSGADSLAIGLASEATNLSTTAIGNHAYAGSGYEEDKNGEYAEIKIIKKVDENKLEETKRYVKFDKLSSEIANIKSKDKDYQVEIKTSLGYTKSSNDKAIKRYTRDKLGQHALAIGNSAYATNTFASAFGNNSYAKGKYAQSFGSSSQASGENSLAVGYKTRATSYGATAIGFKTLANGEKTIAIGNKTFAGFRDVDFVRDEKGKYIDYNGNYYKLDANDKITLEDGKVIDIKATHPDILEYKYKPVEVIHNSDDFEEKANGEYGKIGKRYVKLVDGKYFDIEKGEYVNYSGKKYKGTEPAGYSLALGYHASSPSRGSLAIGYNAHSIGDHSVAIGNKAITYGDHSIALGQKAEVKESLGIAIGNTAIAKEKNSLSLGNNTISEVIGSIALGNKSVADRAAGEIGYNPKTDNKEEIKKDKSFVSNRGALSIGRNEEYEDPKTKEKELILRQITGVSAGSQDTDAVNVAQLKSLNEKVADDLEIQAKSFDKKLNETKISYSANNKNANNEEKKSESVLLSKGFNFVNGDNNNITVKINGDGEVKFNLNNDIKLTNGKITGLRDLEEKPDKSDAVNVGYLDKRINELKAVDSTTEKAIENLEKKKIKIAGVKAIKVDGQDTQDFKISVNVDGKTIQIKDDELVAKTTTLGELKDNEYKPDDKDALIKASDVADVLNKGLTFKTNSDKDIKKTLGETLSILGKAGATYNQDIYSSDNLITHEDGGVIRIAMLKNPKFDSIKIGEIPDSEIEIKTSVDTVKDPVTGKEEKVAKVIEVGKNGEPIKISNVADGTNPTDVINKGQLDNLEKDIRNNGLGVVVYTDKDGNRVYKENDKYYKVSDKTEVNDIYASIVNEKTSTDEIVGSDVTFRNVKSTIGGVGVSNTEASEKTQALVGTYITYNDDGTEKERKGNVEKLNHAATLDDLRTVAVAGLTFAGNKGEVHRSLGKTLNIIGQGVEYDENTKKLKDFAAASGNIAVVKSKDKNDTLEIQLNENLKNLKKADFGENISIDGDKHTISFTKDGDNAVGKITGLADGTDIHDAVNKGQLDKKADKTEVEKKLSIDDLKDIKAGNGIKLDGSNLANEDVKVSLQNQITLGEKQTTKEENGKKIIESSGEVGNIKLISNDNDNYLTLNGKDGLDFSNRIKIKEGMIEIDDIKLTSIKDGAPILNDTKKIARLKVGDNEVATMKDGLIFKGDKGASLTKELNHTIEIHGGATSLTDNNIGVNIKDNKINIQLSKVLTGLEKAEFGKNISIDGNNNLITFNPTIEEKTKDDGTKEKVEVYKGKIEGIADGENPHDAVNKGQLDEIEKKLNADKLDKTSLHKIKAGKGIEISNEDLTQGNVVVSLKDNLEIGTDKNSGSIKVNGKDNKTITINGNDGIKTAGENGESSLNENSLIIKGKDGKEVKISSDGIGINGKDANADIKVSKDGDNTRIVYTDKNNKNYKVATTEDGLKFIGNDGVEVTRKLNETLNIKGYGITKSNDKLHLDGDPSKIFVGAKGNIAVVKNDKDTLEIQLNKNLHNLSKADFITKDQNGKDIPSISIDGDNHTISFNPTEIAKQDGSKEKVYNGKITGLADLDSKADGHRAVNKNYVDEVKTALDNAKFGVKDQTGKGLSQNLNTEISIKGGKTGVKTEVIENSLVIDLTNNIKIGENQKDKIGNIQVFGEEKSKFVNINGNNGIETSGDTNTVYIKNGIKITDKNSKHELNLNEKEISLGKDKIKVLVIKEDNGKGHILIDGKDISVNSKGLKNLNDNKEIPRLKFDDKELATLYDGLIFAGNDEKFIKLKLNKQLNIIGEGVTKDNAKTFVGAKGNIAVINKNDNLEIQLNKNLHNLSTADFGDGNIIINGKSETKEVEKKDANGNPLKDKDGNVIKEIISINPSIRFDKNNPGVISGIKDIEPKDTSDDTRAVNKKYVDNFVDNVTKAQTLTYKANKGTNKSTKLSDGLDFTDGANTTAEIGDKGVVKFNLNPTLEKMQGINFNGGTTINNNLISFKPTIEEKTKDDGTKEKVKVYEGKIEGLADLKTGDDGHRAVNKNYVDGEIIKANEKIDSNSSDIAKNKEVQDKWNKAQEATNKALGDDISNNAQEIAKNKEAQDKWNKAQEATNKALGDDISNNAQEIAKNKEAQDKWNEAQEATNKALGDDISNNAQEIAKNKEAQDKWNAAQEATNKSLGDDISNNAQEIAKNKEAQDKWNEAQEETNKNLGDQIANNTKNINNKANVDLDNITDNGKKVITGLSTDVKAKKDSIVTVDNSIDATTGKKTFTIDVDKNALSKGVDLTYKANNEDSKTVSLNKGLDFTNGKNTTAEIGDNGVVKFNLNKELKDINTISNGDKGAKITLNKDNKNIDFNNGKLVNIAAGENDTDAVNMKQLKEVKTKADSAIQNITSNDKTITIKENGTTRDLSVNTNGTIAKDNSGIVNGGTIYNEVHVEKDGRFIKEKNTVSVNLKALDDGISNIYKVEEEQNKAIADNTKSIGDIHEELHEVGSLSAAMAQLHPVQYDPKRPSQVMAGLGSYKNKQAVAVGLSHYFTENLMMTASASVSQAKRVTSMVGLGLTYKFGKDDPRERREYPVGYNKQHAAEIYEMQTQMYAVASEAKQEKAKNQKLEKKVQNLNKDMKKMKNQNEMLLKRLERLEKLLEKQN